MAERSDRVRRAMEQAETAGARRRQRINSSVYWLLTLGVPLLFALGVGDRMTPGRYQLSGRLFGPWVYEYQDGTYALVDRNGNAAYHQQINDREDYVVTSAGDIYKQTEKRNGEMDVQIIGHIRPRE